MKWFRRFITRRYRKAILRDVHLYSNEQILRRHDTVLYLLEREKDQTCRANLSVARYALEIAGHERAKQLRAR